MNERIGILTGGGLTACGVSLFSKLSESPTEPTRGDSAQA